MAIHPVHSARTRITVGLALGCTVGTGVGDGVGEIVVGSRDGDVDGVSDGTSVDVTDGAAVGALVGTGVGLPVGARCNGVVGSGTPGGSFVLLLIVDSAIVLSKSSDGTSVGATDGPWDCDMLGHGVKPGGHCCVTEDISMQKLNSLMQVPLLSNSHTSPQSN